MPANPEFSIVVASYLSLYKDGATYREQKFIRAIDSCLNQTFTDYEIVIVADGCAITKQLYNLFYSGIRKIKLVEIPKQVKFSAAVRNTGIDNASGKYITYLDTDDKLGKNHLQILHKLLENYDWVYYDDYLMNKKYEPGLNTCELRKGQCGTSNITHKRELNARWISSGYALDDWSFISELMKHSNYTKTATPEYIICHQPRRVDV